ncbi:MAG: helix-turn-helix domain-containing protein [Oscillospiraceae bacterium]
MESKNTCVEVFGKRLKELRKANGYTIEQFADMVGISKSTLGYYENDKRMPDIEILARIADTLNVNADYLIGRTNTTAQKGKMKTVCEFTGLSDNAAEYLAQLVKDKDYEKLSIINHLFDELTEDYDFYCYETQNGEETASSVLGALFLYFERCSDTDSVWNEFADLGNNRRKEILAAAYKQLLLNQVTDLVKTSAEAYRRDNEPM